MLKLHRRVNVNKELEKCKQEMRAMCQEIHSRQLVEEELRSELSAKEIFLKEVYCQIQKSQKLIHQLLNFQTDMRDDDSGMFDITNKDLALLSYGTERSSFSQLAQSQFSSEASNQLNALTVSQIVPAGTELFVQGSVATEVYFIEKGMVKLIYQESDGKEVIVALRFPGWPLASASVVLNASLPLTAVTLSRCHLRSMQAEDFRCLVKSNLDLSWDIHRMFAREICSHVAHLTGIECLSARQRLEELIWQFISAAETEADKPVRLQFPAKHSEIAQFLAVTPQYVSWLLRQLEREKTLKRDKGWLIIYQPQSLWHRPDLSGSSQAMARLFAGCFDYSKDVLRLVE